MAQIVAVAASSQHILPPIRKEVDLNQHVSLIRNHPRPNAHLIQATFCFMKMTAVTIPSSFKVLESAINPQTFLASAQKRQDPTAPVSPISSPRRSAIFSRTQSRGAVRRKYAGVLNYQ